MKQGMAGLPKKLTCILNSSSPLLKNIIDLNKAGKTDQVNLVCQQVVDLAVLSNQPLEGDNLQQFLTRSFDLLNNSIDS
jgi:molecular chaperone HtpG